MAGKLGAARRLGLGLVIVALGLAALAETTQAGWFEHWAARRAQDASPADPQQPQPRPRPALPPAHPRPQIARANTGTPLSPDEVDAISHAQRCLTELGYYKGQIDGKRGRTTWTAFWHFKHEHDLSDQSDLLALPVQQKLAELCKNPEDTAGSEPGVNSGAEPQTAESSSPSGSESGAAESGEGVALASPETPNNETSAIGSQNGDESNPPAQAGDGKEIRPQARLALDCLAPDLAELIRRAHGPGVAVDTCERPCVTAPSGLSDTKRDELRTASGVVWCADCVTIAGHLALDDVRRIERAGHFQLCPTPQPEMPKYGGGPSDVRSSMRVRELYRDVPPVAEDPEAYAVIIGNRNYDRLPQSVTSSNDAAAMDAFLIEHLGYRPDNIIDLRDAKKADLERVFGVETGFAGDLSRLVESEPNAKILIYYSGHGATDEAQTDTYILPTDAEPYREASGGYKLATLYANLAALKAKSVLVLLEMEYGPDHGASLLPPNLPQTVRNALPQTSVAGLTVLAATDRGQRSLPDVTYDIGLFTRYVIEALSGRADLPPVGNGDGALDSAEIYAYTAAFVDLAARKTFGVLQHPIYSGAASNVLISAETATSGAN